MFVPSNKLFELGRLGVFYGGKFYISEKDQILAVPVADIRKLDVPLRRRLDRVDSGGIHPDDVIEDGSNPAVAVDTGEATVLLYHLDHRAGVSYHIFFKQIRRRRSPSWQKDLLTLSIDLQVAPR